MRNEWLPAVFKRQHEQDWLPGGIGYNDSWCSGSRLRQGTQEARFGGVIWDSVLGRWWGDVPEDSQGNFE